MGDPGWEKRMGTRAGIKVGTQAGTGADTEQGNKIRENSG